MRTDALQYSAAPQKEFLDRTFELGIWVFLISEAMLFAALLSGASAYRILYADAFMQGARHLKLVLGSINTFVLLTSSMFVAFGVTAGKQNQFHAVRRSFLIALGLGVLFLCIKGTEYYLEYREGLVPGVNFTFTGPQAPHVKLFFILYFFITLLHALHLTIGLGLLAAITVFCNSSVWLTKEIKLVSAAGLYWHFVDIVWVFVFPILYLNGRSG